MKKKKILLALRLLGKPDNIVEKILEGKVNKYFEQICLLEQPFVKDTDMTIEALLKAKIAEIGGEYSGKNVLSVISWARRRNLSSSSKSDLAYKRVLLKLSGEALKGSQQYGVDLRVVENLARQIKRVVDLGVQLALVVGGGNIFRGVNVVNSSSLDRVTGDYMGMMATVINGLALQNVLEHNGVQTRVQAALEMGKLVEPFVLRKTQKYLEENNVVIFVAGTGNPYFSTDTAAALRASEIQADIIFKATKVDGVYSDDH